MKNNVKKLMVDTIEKCVAGGITFKLDKRKYTYSDGMFCSGYFCDKAKILCAAIGKSESMWLPIFVHESCHLDQSVEDILLWKRGSESADRLFTALNEKDDINKKDVEHTILLEKDCEERSIKKIKKYKLNVDVKRYIQSANVYLLSYWMVYKHKKWVCGIYDKVDLSKFPSTFMSDKDCLNPKSELQKLLQEFY